MSKPEALVRIEPQALAGPSPIFRGSMMVQALTDYRDLQKALDASMPDQLMKLDGKDFRKKGYWRAIAVAFRLTVEPVTDSQQERSVIGTLEDGSENYVYTVAYRATEPNGRSAMGDGTCAASEKQRGRMKATEHNVRSHAHTRAFNRAVSNLVGFGEVSAEELDRDESHESPPSVVRQAPQRNGDASLGVFDVAERHGGKPGQRAWTMYTVFFDDHSEATTFDAATAAAAMKAMADGTRVIPITERKGKYTNLLSLTPEASVVKGGVVEEAQRRFDDEVHGEEDVPF